MSAMQRAATRGYAFAVLTVFDKVHINLVRPGDKTTITRVLSYLDIRDAIIDVMELELDKMINLMEVEPWHA